MPFTEEELNQVADNALELNRILYGDSRPATRWQKFKAWLDRKRYALSRWIYPEEY